KTYPTRLTIRHLGSGQTWHMPLKWAADHTSDSTFAIPAAAKLGEYSVSLDDGDLNATSNDTNDNSDDNEDNSADSARHSYSSGSFRVEEFRLPVFKGTIAVRDEKTHPLVAASEAPVTLQIDYMSGGGASGLPVQVSALMKSTTPAFAGTYPEL